MVAGFLLHLSAYLTAVHPELLHPVLLLEDTRAVGRAMELRSELTHPKRLLVRRSSFLSCKLNVCVFQYTEYGEDTLDYDILTHHTRRAMLTILPHSIIDY